MAAASSTRMAPRSQAVESYLRNFERERQRLQEVLEVTLCYGIFCLSQNFSLKGMSIEELRAVTKYEAIKKRDFFVLSAGINARRVRSDGLELSNAAQQEQLIRVKPSHSWRDGNEDAEILKPALRGPQGDREFVETTATATNQYLSENLLLSAEKKPLDEIDFFAKLFGKQFIDTAWTTFAGRNGSQIASKDALDERFTRIDQRKVTDKFPSLELPVTSFVEFLSEYVKVCVGHHHHHQSVGGLEKRDNERDANSESPFPHKNVNGDARSAMPTRPQRAIGNTTGPLRTRKSGGEERPDRVSRTTPTSDQLRVLRPKFLQHVQSKIKPELDARREKLLRVKKTQTQLMKESLARARLAEYERKRMLDASGSIENDNSGLKSVYQQRARKIPLSDITTGAAALEIADDFMKSPLMDSFSGKENRDDRSRQNTSSAKDSLREELYGAAALDDSFLGCKPPPPVTPMARKPQSKKPNRAYNGWLGDFGPLHTKTVVSEWGTLVDDVADSDDANEASVRAQDRRSPSKQFEWKFDGTDSKSAKRWNQRKSSEDDFSSTYSDKENRLSDDDADGFSDGGLSEVSDPVFKWLKRAV